MKRLLRESRLFLFYEVCFLLHFCLSCYAYTSERTMTSHCRQGPASMQTDPVKLAGSAKRTCTPPRLSSPPGAGVVTTRAPQEPKRCRELLCRAEHGIHLMTLACLSCGYFALRYFWCHADFLCWSNKVRRSGLVNSWHNTMVSTENIGIPAHLHCNESSVNGWARLDFLFQNPSCQRSGWRSG